ncbi:MAG: alpha/beta hydrolase [Planctomycetota bacterium]|nr:alpha/beta hydrolase [Planctomycetota bacterium]
MNRRTSCGGAMVWVAAVLMIASVRAAEPPADVVFEPDITYATVAGEELKLNLARPKDAKGDRPCILVIHGGAWRAGDRAGHNDLTWKFAQRGYVSATIGYRFCPKYLFPAQVQDVKCAVRFLRANAGKYNIDVNRFGAVGFSAGAHLSMMLGVMDKADGLDDSGGWPDQSSKVQAVVSFFGPTDMREEFPAASVPLLLGFLGGTPTEKPEAHRLASPVTYVTAGDAPMLLFQGTKDPLVPHQQAILMLDAMTKAGVPGRVELLAGSSHGWGGAELNRTVLAMNAFFDEYLLKKSAAK